jgi:hypothetical protein
MLWHTAESVPGESITTEDRAYFMAFELTPSI